MLDTPIPMVPTPLPMVLTTLARGRLRLSPRLMLMLLFSMVPMVMLLLMLDTVPMLDTPIPMVLTPMPMVPTTLERGRLRLSPRLMLMPLFSMVPMVMLLLMLDTMPMLPTPTPMVATVHTWDKKFSFPPVLLNSITIAYQAIYLRKRSKTSPNDCHPDLPHNQ